MATSVNPVMMLQCARARTLDPEPMDDDITNGVVYSGESSEGIPAAVRQPEVEDTKAVDSTPTISNHAEESQSDSCTAKALRCLPCTLLLVLTVFTGVVVAINRERIILILGSISVDPAISRKYKVVALMINMIKWKYRVAAATNSDIQGRCARTTTKATHIPCIMHYLPCISVWIRGRSATMLKIQGSSTAGARTTLIQGRPQPSPLIQGSSRASHTG